MKKAFVLFVAMAMTMAMASVAMAEITMDGSIEFLLRSVKNTQDWYDKTKGAGDFNQTYERVRLGFNAKHEGVKGRVQIETDWDTWADGAGNPGFETRPTNDFYMREGWIDFNMPFGIPGHIKVGRQFLQLGNGWFFRSGKYGSDAWVIGFPGKNTIAFVNVKAAENNTALSDDTDAYVLLDTFKIDDKNAVGAYIAHIKDRNNVWVKTAFGAGDGDTTLNNLGLHYSGVVGPVSLKAEIDLQSGELNSNGVSNDFGGTQVVLQAGMNMDALAVRATAAQGSGDKIGSTGNKIDSFVPFLDKDPHYTLVYEYFMQTACDLGVITKNSAFCNTTALGVGADFKVNDMITVGADIWMLSATEKVLNGAGTQTDDLGTEFDVKVNLKLADQLTWNTTVGLFQSGKAYDVSATQKADDVQAIQSVLSYKF